MHLWWGEAKKWSPYLPTTKGWLRKITQAIKQKLRLRELFKWFVESKRGFSTVLDYVLNYSVVTPSFHSVQQLRLDTTIRQEQRTITQLEALSLHKKNGTHYASSSIHSLCHSDIVLKIFPTGRHVNKSPFLFIRHKSHIVRDFTYYLYPHVKMGILALHKTYNHNSSYRQIIQRELIRLHQSWDARHSWPWRTWGHVPTEVFGCV